MNIVNYVICVCSFFVYMYVLSLVRQNKEAKAIYGSTVTTQYSINEAVSYPVKLDRFGCCSKNRRLLIVL